jgi:hypothetical protein
MRGQWLGTYTGTNSGTATVDVDEIGNRFRGYAYLFENNPALPDTRAEINVAEPAGNSLVAQLPVSPLNRNTGGAAVASNYPPGTTFPNYADVQMSWTPIQLTASWKTNINTSGSMTPGGNAS